jgi:DNA topoisomerase IB
MRPPATQSQAAQNDGRLRHSAQRHHGPGDLEAKSSGRLRRSDCAEPGIRRRRCGRGFAHVGPDGERIEDPAALELIA